MKTALIVAVVAALTVASWCVGYSRGFTVGNRLNTGTDPAALVSLIARGH